MYGGSGSPARCRGLAVEAHAPAALAEVLDELDGAVARARLQPARRAGEREPLAAALVLEQQHFALRLVDPDPGRHDPRVVHDGELAGELVRQLGERAVADVAGRALVDEQPRRVAALRRMLRDQLRRQVVVELAGIHPTARVLSHPWTSSALERAKARIAAAASGRVAPAELEAALERARAQIEALAEAAAAARRRRCRRRSAPRSTTASGPRCSRSRGTSPRSAAC